MPLDVSLGGLGATGPGDLLPPAPGGPRPISPARPGLNLSAREFPARAPTRGGAADSFGAAAGEGAGSSAGTTGWVGASVVGVWADLVGDVMADSVLVGSIT